MLLPLSKFIISNFRFRPLRLTHVFVIAGTRRPIVIHKSFQITKVITMDTQEHDITTLIEFLGSQPHPSPRV